MYSFIAADIQLNYLLYILLLLALSKYAWMGLN